MRTDHRSEIAEDQFNPFQFYEQSMATNRQTRARYGTLYSLHASQSTQTADGGAANANWVAEKGLATFKRLYQNEAMRIDRISLCMHCSRYARFTDAYRMRACRTSPAALGADARIGWQPLTGSNIYPSGVRADGRADALGGDRARSGSQESPRLPGFPVFVRLTNTREGLDG